jgi:hypothetical protein
MIEYYVFKRTANATILGAWEGDKVSTLTRTAGLEKTASHFLQNAGKVDLEAGLADIADEYAISKNPRDYLLIPVRANSIGVPNENGDAFSREESLRFDHRIGRRVYQTYLLKPHHVNHRADNPRMARGFIADVHYNDVNPMPDEWRRKYEASTGQPQPKDEFVEALIAMDTSKDPYLAKGLKSGVIKAFSMGCECESTQCSLPWCGKVATNKLEFCPHIRYGNKMKWFANPSDPRMKLQAFEHCLGVNYSELSAVDQPADPRALTIDSAMQMRASQELLTREDKIELLAFSKVNADRLPVSVQKLIAEVLS